MLYWTGGLPPTDDDLVLAQQMLNEDPNIQYDAAHLLAMRRPGVRVQLELAVLSFVEWQNIEMFECRC